MKGYFTFLLAVSIFVSVQALIVKNCARFDDNLLQCLKCEDWYFLNRQDNYCQKQRLRKIQHQTKQQKYFQVGNHELTLSQSNLNKLAQFRQRLLLKQDLNTDCLAFNPRNFSQCILCPQNYYPFGQACKKIPKNCLIYNKQSGQCEICKQNYQLVQNICITKNCNQFSTQTQKCIKCESGYHLDSQNMCIMLKKDSNCKVFDISNKCQQCMNFFYVQKSTENCVPVSTVCRTYDKDGKCTTCYPGYSLVSQTGECQISKVPYCKVQSKNSSSPQCIECMQGFFLATNTNLCKPINPLCKEFNLTDGKCLSCYRGYMLISGQCKIFIPDPYCKVFNEQSKKCEECIQKYYLKSENCVMVNALCKSYDNISGQCTNCYNGYKLAYGQCVIISSYESYSQVQKSIIMPNCKIIKNQLCSQCQYGYFVNSTGFCQQVSKLCLTYNLQNGVCLTCYPGYALVNNRSCQIQIETLKISLNKDPNCVSYITNSPQCQKCTKNYFISQNGECKKVDEQCKTFNPKNGSCLSCYNLYILKSGKCQFMLQVFQQSPKTTNSVVPSQKQQQITLNSGARDINCVKYKSGTCIECSIGFYLSSNKVCTQLDPLCKSHSLTNGQCLSCYEGYFFNITNKKCQIVKNFTIPYCQSINPITKFCDSCMFGYYLSPTMTECLYLSILCTKYEMQTGKCYQCINGYVLQNGQCVYPALGIDWYCVNYQQGFCKKCRSGYLLFNYRCMEMLTTNDII